MKMSLIDRILESNSCMTSFIILLLVISGICYGLTKLTNKQTETVNIISIDKVEDRSGNSNGFYTEVYYIVTTNKGSYRIETTGINAHPECLAIKKDSTYIIETRGISFPVGGIYPSIISYKTLNN